MRQLLKLLHPAVLALVLAQSGAAQNSPEPGSDEASPAAEDATEAVDDTDTAPVDTESYLDIEEDDFTPSEEIPADQSIDFPTDI